jgi:hypothetical protein
MIVAHAVITRRHERFYAMRLYLSKKRLMFDL